METPKLLEQFKKGMEEVRKLNQECYEWIKQIPPQHWARRSHFDVVINNICECFNSKILEGRDAPIINCLEFIGEYIIKRIVNVDKATGPLTPTATKILQKIKDEAEEYISWVCGNGKYQVNGPCQD
uniref:Uncharacterized protein n=1 Tax=Lactuca sativa TaxID=4236 RepID=A0A9R1XBH7_LACSA|nr:hypothetical protein LSAT_V11C500271090 [Lactuca sativa]